MDILPGHFSLPFPSHFLDTVHISPPYYVGLGYGNVSMLTILMHT